MKIGKHTRNFACSISVVLASLLVTTEQGRSEIPKVLLEKSEKAWPARLSYRYPHKNVRRTFFPHFLYQDMKPDGSPDGEPYFKGIMIDEEGEQRLDEWGPTKSYAKPDLPAEIFEELLRQHEAIAKEAPRPLNLFGFETDMSPQEVISLIEGKGYRYVDSNANSRHRASHVSVPVYEKGPIGALPPGKYYSIQFDDHPWFEAFNRLGTLDLPPAMIDGWSETYPKCIYIVRVDPGKQSGINARISFDPSHDLDGKKAPSAEITRIEAEFRNGRELTNSVELAVTSDLESIPMKFDYSSGEKFCWLDFYGNRIIATARGGVVLTPKANRRDYLWGPQSALHRYSDSGDVKYYQGRISSLLTNTNSGGESL